MCSGVKGDSSNQFRRNFVDANELQNDNESVELFELTGLYWIDKKGAYPNKFEPSKLKLLIENVALEVQVDPGSFYTIMILTEKEILFPKKQIIPTHVEMKFYNGSIFKSIGVMQKLKVELEKDSGFLDIYIAEEGSGTLMGRQWLKAFELWPPVYPKQIENWHALDKISNKCELEIEPVPSGLNEILEENKQVYTDKLGCFNKGYLEFKVKDGTQPVLKKSRSLPIALKT